MALNQVQIEYLGLVNFLVGIGYNAKTMRLDITDRTLRVVILFQKRRRAFIVGQSDLCDDDFHNSLIQARDHWDSSLQEERKNIFKASNAFKNMREIVDFLVNRGFPVNPDDKFLQALIE